MYLGGSWGEGNSQEGNHKPHKEYKDSLVSLYCNKVALIAPLFFLELYELQFYRSAYISIADKTSFATTGVIFSMFSIL